MATRPTDVETDSPRDTCAVIVSGQANLIYVHRDGYICVLTARIGSEEQRSRDNELYIATAPRVQGHSVQCRARHPRVASVAYFHDFTDEIVSSWPLLRRWNDSADIDVLLSSSGGFITLTRTIISVRSSPMATAGGRRELWATSRFKSNTSLFSQQLRTTIASRSTTSRRVRPASSLPGAQRDRLEPGLRRRKSRKCSSRS